MGSDGSQAIIFDIKDADITIHARLKKRPEEEEGEDEQNGGEEKPADAATTTTRRIQRLLVADRGELAVRCIQAAKTHGIHTVAIYEADTEVGVDDDSLSLHVVSADEAVRLPRGCGFGDVEEIVRIAKAKGCEAAMCASRIADASFARGVRDAGLVWVGASTNPEVVSEREVREVAREAGLPLIPGTVTSGNVQRECERLAFPVILKGLRGSDRFVVCREMDDVLNGFAALTLKDSGATDGQDVLVERFLPECHHIEVQVFGDGQGNVVSFGERECSIQRRFQPILDECPSPFVKARSGLRKKLLDAAVALTKSFKLETAGTVKFLVDDKTADFYFLGLSVGLDVGHSVNELCYDVDLVELTLRYANGKDTGGAGLTIEDLESLQQSAATGVAIQARVCAEDVSKDHSPCMGALDEVLWEDLHNSRIDTWVKPGVMVSAGDDPLIAKIMNHAKNRTAAIKGMALLLTRSRLSGVQTNLEFLATTVDSEPYKSSQTLTSFLGDFKRDR